MRHESFLKSWRPDKFIGAEHDCNYRITIKTLFKLQNYFDLSVLLSQILHYFIEKTISVLLKTSKLCSLLY